MGAVVMSGTHLAQTEPAACSTPILGSCSAGGTCTLASDSMCDPGDCAAVEVVMVCMSGTRAAAISARKRIRCS
jgi:hypothetical protein